jgi:DNA polymerase I
MNTLLVDADIVAYQISSVTETPIRWENEVWTLHSDEKDCVRLIDDYYQTLKDNTQCEDIYSCFSDKENYRKTISPTYKLNRENVRKPITLKFCREYIFKKYNGFQRPQLEADDVIGILATSNIIKGNKIVCSIDKDLDQIAGLHYNPKSKEFYNITPKEGDYNFYLQTLMGDRTDNVTGCPTYGEVKATRALSSSKNYWNTIIKCYEQQKLSEEDALVQARLVKILQKPNYNFKNKQPILWSNK